MAGKRGRPPKQPVDSPPEQDNSTLSALREMAIRLEADLLAARANGASTRDIATMSTALARTYDRIGKLTGEGEVTEAMILKAPAFSRVKAAIIGALEKHPEAAKDVAAALAPLAGIVPKGK